MLKFFRLPFATTGDKTAVPDAVDSNGNVSYSQGYGFDYQRQKTDPAAKNIERDKMNQILFDITTAIAEIQSQGAPDYITSALNGGTAYSYGQYAIVKYSGALYISLVAANTALPSDATKWALLPTPALLQQSAYMSANAAGTVDAITAAFTPAIAALPAAPGTLSVFVRAGGANTSATPTFKADALAAKTIVKGNNLPLVPGDIAGAGHWLELQYDATLDKWVLQNPARYGANFSQTSVKTLPVALTAADAGALVYLGGSGAVTMPAASDLPNGNVLTIFNTTLNAVTVNRAGADQFAVNGGAYANSITLQPGDSIQFACNTSAGLWLVSGGTGANKYAGSTIIGAQTRYTEVTGSRAIGTVYTNTTGRPLIVSVTIQTQAVTQSGCRLLVGGSEVAQFYTASATSLFGYLIGIVPPGATYQVTQASGTNTLTLWQEL